MHTCPLERGRDIAARRERLHQEYRGALAQRIGRDEALGECDGGGVVADFERLCGEARERRLIAAGEFLPFLLDPPFELGNIRQVNPIQKRPAVQVHRSGQVPSRNRAGETGHVAIDDSRLETQLVRSNDASFAKGLPHDVQDLIEGAARPIGRAFRP